MGYTGPPDGAPKPPDSPEPSGAGGRPARRSLRYRAGNRADSSAARPALECLYHAHFTSLVRLAALLTGDAALAESVAADAMAALLTGPFGTLLPEPDLFWLHRQVVVRSRRAARTKGAESGSGGSQAAHAAAGSAALDPVGNQAWRSDPVMGLLGSLPVSQREAVVLRHYLDLSNEETAAVMGASQRAVRRSLQAASHTLAPGLPGGTEPH